MLVPGHIHNFCATSMRQVSKYIQYQIFNMDEVIFMWKTMPKRNFITEWSHKVCGKKQERECFAILFNKNASGLIQHSKQPRAYKSWDITQLNIHWLLANSKICFNILLLSDNASGHSPLLHSVYPNVCVEFLPANITSLIQLLDMGITSCVKVAHSRKQFRNAREVTGQGFSETTNCDINDMVEPTAVTAEDIITGDEQKTNVPHGEDNPAAETKAVSISKVKEKSGWVNAWSSW